MSGWWIPSDVSGFRQRDHRLTDEHLYPAALVRLAVLYSSCRPTAPIQNAVVSMSCTGWFTPTFIIPFVSMLFCSLPYCLLEPAQQSGPVSFFLLWSHFMDNQLRLPWGFNIDTSPCRWLWLIPVTAFQIKCDVLSFACKFYTTLPSHTQGKPMNPSLKYPVSCLANYHLINYLWDKSLFMKCTLKKATVLSTTQWLFLGLKTLIYTFQKTYSEDSGNCVT